VDLCPYDVARGSGGDELGVDGAVLLVDERLVIVDTQGTGKNP
jgi:hypothetical protein